MTQEELKAKLTETLENETLCEELMRVSSQSGIEWVTFVEEIFGSVNITLEFVDHYGGEEQGRIYYSVIKFISGDSSLLVKFSGDYASHYGVDYTHWSFVTPKKVEITEYV